MQYKSWIVSGVCGAMLVASASVASAANWSLEASDIFTGQNSRTIDIDDGPQVVVSVQQGRVIQGKETHAPYYTQTRGTSGPGGVPGEIDVSPDYFDLDFDTDVFLSELTVAWLFPDGEYGDHGNEVAIFQTFSANSIDPLNTFYLEAQEHEVAKLYSDSGLNNLVDGVIVENLEIAWDGVNDDGPKSGGVWKISSLTSIFGDFDRLRLVGGDDLSVLASGAADSDFSFVSASGAAVVPVPAALPLLGTALAGFALVGWRRKRLAA
ncbi:MAG: VPLPA-CTERM sorting domain-containing protein [Alphaproteobacteria bacterium]